MRITRVRVLDAVRSRLSTSMPFWLSMKRYRRAARSVAHCCVVRACIARILLSGARPATSHCCVGSHQRCRDRNAALNMWSSNGYVDRIGVLNKNLFVQDWRWRSPEKHMRSWSYSPRARTANRSRDRDRHPFRTAQRGDVNRACMRSVGPVACDTLPVSTACRVRPTSTTPSTPARERIDRWRTRRRPRYFAE